MNHMQTWINLSQLSKEDRRGPALVHDLPQNSEEASASQSSDDHRHMPSKRWGHTSVEALNRMFIIGGYQGKSKSTTGKNLGNTEILQVEAEMQSVRNFNLILFLDAEFSD